MLNRREKRVCNCSRMVTWIQKRSNMLTYFLADKRNRNKRNEPPATWLTPQLALHQFARPIVTFGSRPSFSFSRLQLGSTFANCMLSSPHHIICYVIHRLNSNTSIESSAPWSRACLARKAKAISIPSAISQLL